ncbi:MAG: PepSY domain-containing protein [Microbacterium ginsengisoli]|nr:PepSY domain-containing protein [Microbacterium ginsengisoli]
MTTADAPPLEAATPAPVPRRRRINWFAAFWRWHFYGSAIVIPVLLVLAITGLTYLYRAQVDALTHPGVLTVSAPAGAERAPLSAQEAAVRAAYPDRHILSVTDNSGDRSTMFVTAVGDTTRNVYVDPFRASVTGDLSTDELVSDWALRIHGTLLAGDLGDRVIELGACWAIVLSITGGIIFFLGRKPRVGARRKRLPMSGVRSTHAWVGLGVGVGILFLVVSGLPWTGFWGAHAQQVAAQNGTGLWGEDPGASSTVGDLIERTDGSSGPAGWAISEGRTGTSTGAGSVISIDTAVATARAQGAPEPYFVAYPEGETGVYSVFGDQWHNNGNPAESDVSLETTVHVDQYSGAVVGQYGYADYSTLAKIVSQGIAGHEGRRFGPLNTVITTAFCLGVIFLCVTGPVLWWKRRAGATGMAAPRGRLPLFTNIVLLAAVVALGLFLPLFGLSLLVILALDLLVIRRVPALRQFFGSV